MIEVMGRGFWRWVENETGAGRRLSKGRERSACSLMDIGIGAIMNNGARLRSETRVALSKENGQRTRWTKRLIILRPRETKPQYGLETL